MNESYFNYKRRETTPVAIKTCIIGGDNNIVLQSMGNTSTNDIEASAEQAYRIAMAGGSLVRFTTQGNREAENISNIKSMLKERFNCNVPLVADVHFNAKVAETAATTADKVRINPGNFVTPQGSSTSYTPEQKERELGMVKSALHRVIDICKEHDTALRIGVNHGSLSPRMMFKHGDTPMGLAMSCIEFLELCEAEDFRRIVLSIKASNVVVMVQTVRLLVKEMDARGMHYPLHLGVTEAGDGEDGRVKSAVGIGTLLLEGLGDTIRVSLSEAPEAEIPVAKRIVEYIKGVEGHTPIQGERFQEFNPLVYSKRKTVSIDGIGGNVPPVVISDSTGTEADFTSGELEGQLYRIQFSALTTDFLQKIKENPKTLLLYSQHQHPVGEMRAAFHLLSRAGINVPVIIERDYDMPLEQLQIVASIELGALLLDGFGDGLYIRSKQTSEAETTSLAYAILQATRARISRVEYIACPSCGRTMFDLPKTLQQIKQATAHLKGVKIGVMGCIVNGPGEMADADYGYVGAGRGRISLYKGQQCIEKSIPEENAVERLLDLLRQDGHV